MSGYTKLFNLILASTIWEADMPTRIVWITMLAMKNQHGVVEASIPGLATLARVPIAQVRQAIENLKAADPDSRSKEDEGRRIRDVDGGWFIINHDKYRRMLSAEERREYLRIKQAEYRAKKQESTPVNTVSDKYTKLTHTEEEEEEEEETKEEVSVPPTPKAKHHAISPTESAPSALDVRFSEFWSAYPKRIGKGAALKAWKKLKPSTDLCARITAAIATQRQSDQWRKGDGQFIPNPATWLNQGRWDDEPQAAEAVREPGTWIGGFRVEDMVRTPEEVARDEEWEKQRARYR